MTHLASLTDEELLSWFRCTRNDLTTSELEIALAERLEAAADRKDAELEELRKQVRQLNDELEEAGRDERAEIDALQKKLDDIQDICTNR